MSVAAAATDEQDLGALVHLLGLMTPPADGWPVLPLWPVAGATGIEPERLANLGSFVCPTGDELTRVARACFDDERARDLWLYCARRARCRRCGGVHDVEVPE